jgi:hypothetical protein
MTETTIWETPVKGKVAFCELIIDGKARTVSLEVWTYGKEPSKVSAAIFKDNIECSYVVLYYDNRLITNIWTESSLDLTIHDITKIVKETNSMTVLHIYCSSGELLYGELKERRQ